jgi:phi LC3 family holin
MNINWKARLTNKTFWVAIVSTVVLLTQELGLNIFPSNWVDILNAVLTVLIILGIVIDPSTAGISDKEEDTAVIVAKEIERIVEETKLKI